MTKAGDPSYGMCLDLFQPMLQARETLRQHDHRDFQPDTLYDLVLLATGSEEKANDARITRCQQIMDDAERMQGYMETDA